MVTKTLIYFIFYVIIISFVGFSLYSLVQQGLHGLRVIDCTWSEISPDFTPQAREECRKLRTEKVK